MLPTSHAFFLCVQLSSINILSSDDILFKVLTPCIASFNIPFWRAKRIEKDVTKMFCGVLLNISEKIWLSVIINFGRVFKFLINSSYSESLQT